MKAFDTENSAWSRFSAEQRYQMERTATNTVNFSTQPGRNAWPIRKYSAKPRKPASSPSATIPASRPAIKSIGTKRENRSS